MGLDVNNKEKYSEIIEFENEDGSFAEMEIIDEFVLDDIEYIALRPCQIDPESFEDVLPQFFLITEDGEDAVFEMLEDAALIAKLSDMLEERLME